MKTPPDSSNKSRSQSSLFNKEISNKVRRKIRARQAKSDSEVWFGLGFIGLLGWSVVTPVLLGMALGLWLDLRFPSIFSWTLALMLAGLTLGCLIAWEWVSKEQQRMAKPQPPDDLHQPQEGE